MRAEQISVFLENKAGRLAEVTGILSEAKVNIRALALADTSDFGVLRLIVDNNEKAVEALKNRGFTVGRTDVLAVEVEDRPGGLHSILDILNGAGINVEYM
ncbi:MAG: ACT domain-containing protein, partial [Desulfobacterales bacterium]